MEAASQALPLARKERQVRSNIVAIARKVLVQLGIIVIEIALLTDLQRG
jgi:hypothetical protein